MPVSKEMQKLSTGVAGFRIPVPDSEGSTGATRCISVFLPALLTADACPFPLETPVTRKRKTLTPLGPACSLTVTLNIHIYNVGRLHFGSTACASRLTWMSFPSADTEARGKPSTALSPRTQRQLFNSYAIFLYDVHERICKLQISLLF